MRTTRLAQLTATLRRSPIDTLLLLALALALLPGVGLALLDLIPLPAQLDFATYYLAAQALNAGQSPYDRAALAALAERQGGLPHAAYFYPPAFAALLRPLALLPFPLASGLWLALNLLWYGAGVALLARLLRLPRRWHGPLLAASLLVPALHHTLELGQINTILLALLAGALLALETGRREGLGGALLGGAGAVKLFPLILGLPLPPQRRWAALGGLVAALAGWAAAGLVAGGGPAVSVAWLSEVLPGLAGGFASPNNQSVLAAAARLGAPTEVEPLGLAGAPARLTVAPLIPAPAALRAAGLAVAAALGAATLLALLRRWRRAGAPAGLPLEAAALLALSLLATPIVWYHYYVLLIIPVGLGLRAGWGEPGPRRLILAGCLLIAAQRYWRATVLLGSPLLLSFGTLGVLMIWWALLQLLARGPGDAA